MNQEQNNFQPTPRSTRVARAWTLSAYAVALVAAIVGAAYTTQSTMAAPHDDEINHAEYLPNGEVKIPENWRSWIFIGANLTPNGLNGGKAFFPEFHYSYMEPSAWEYYKRTGEFADGTQIVKELVLLDEGTFPDGSRTGPVGRGFYAKQSIVLALEIKDSERFADKPGGWGFFDFGQGQPFKKSAVAHKDETCAGCHELAKETDYVFTDHYTVMMERESEYAPVVDR